MTANTIVCENGKIGCCLGNRLTKLRLCRGIFIAWLSGTAHGVHYFLTINPMTKNYCAVADSDPIAFDGRVGDATMVLYHQIDSRTATMTPPRYHSTGVASDAR